MSTPDPAAGRPPAEKSPHAPQAPVFADPSGRRRRRMRLLGAGLGAALLASLAVMAVGAFGGPQASFLPWNALNGSTAAARATAAGTAAAKSPHLAASPAPGGAATFAPATASPSPGRSPSPTPTRSPSTSPGGSPSASGSASPAPSVTNSAGKTPPGRTRSPSPRPSPSHSAH